ncbi:MAG: GWxTD domain-containing protein [Candidatus Aminicenantes bacterium]|nr:GWxTD domain-containing protein [Candidatus Aminicenantes bacterium]
MKKKHLIIPAILIISLALPGNLLCKSEKSLLKGLQQKYRDWFELVTHVIAKEEKNTFFKLDNDRDRDVFISLFWNLRDPTPDTEKNEFQQEQIKRFQHANKYFKYGVARAGWKTDMGKIYIILGQPDSTERYEVETEVVPTQIWSYYGKKRPGLPASFWIVFFKKDGMGEYKLYDPASDGPYMLLRKTRDTFDMNPLDTEANYVAINDYHPVLARASLSLIPNDDPYNFNPSLRSQQLLMRVMEHPRKQINDTYATNFLKYKGHVDVDYSMNYIEAQRQVMVYKNRETGLNLINFALRPNNITAATSGEGDNYSFNFDMTVSLKKGEKAIFEYRKRFPFSGGREELLRKFSNSLVFSDCFPAVEGDYKLSVLLQNQVNKEFTYFETGVSIKPGSPDLPVITGPIISKTIKKIIRRAFIPFKFMDNEVAPDPRKIFGTEDKVRVLFGVDRGAYRKNFKIFFTVQHLTQPEKYKKSYPVAAAPGKDLQFFNRELETMPPGYYEAGVRLRTAKGVLISEKQEQFTVSTAKHIADTSGIYRLTSYENSFLYYHILGLQYMRLNNLEKAETFLAKAFNLRPDYAPLILDYARLLLKRNKPARALTVVEKIKTLEKFRFNYYALQGKAFFQRKEYKNAVGILRKANELYDSDVSVLNVLGYAYLQTGEKEEAKKVFSASLRLQRDQEKIAKLLDELK